MVSLLQRTGALSFLSSKDILAKPTGQYLTL